MPAARSGTAAAAISGPTESLLANIALLYYKEGLNQGDIARRTGLSRATVVNYLREARARGIVDIRVAGKPMTLSNEARRLREMFGLQDVYVADAGSETDADMNLRQTARVAAAAFYDIVNPGDRIGVAWGQTMKVMADEMSEHAVRGAEVCQIIGAMDTTRLLAAETCAIEIASKTGAVCHTLHAPAVLSSADLARALCREPALQRQLARLQKMDCLFTSVSNLSEAGHLMASGIVSAVELQDVRTNGGVSFICSRFLNANGNCIETGLYDRMIAASLQDILSPAKRAVVASGLQKLEALEAALRGGFVTHLVVDHVIAAALLK